MCLYPRLIPNPKYKPNAKNGGRVPAINDERVLRVPVGCGNCMECRKQKARGWQLRMLEDLKHNTNGKFITLTYSNESIKELEQEIRRKIKIPNAAPDGYDMQNQIATIGVRRFLERWRKQYKKSVRHWLVTELGHEGTENIHLHGILWTGLSYQSIRDQWAYGYIWPRPEKEKITYVSEKTVNYIIKYITKKDDIHKTYNGIILTSAGIGKGYTDHGNAQHNQYNANETNECYRTSTGHKIAMPTYWRNKIYSEEERERLWIEKINKQERYINGERIDISKGEEKYYKALEYHRKNNIALGYGTHKREWKQEEYERIRTNIMLETRIQNASSRQRKKVPTQ